MLLGVGGLLGLLAGLVAGSLGLHVLPAPATAWEHVESPDRRTDVYRRKADGGWVYMATRSGGVSVAYVPSGATVEVVVREPAGGR